MVQLEQTQAVATPYVRVQALDLVLGLVPACLLCASSSRCDTICRAIVKTYWKLAS